MCNKDTIRNTLSSHFLFSPCSPELLDVIAYSCQCLTFKTGEVIKGYDANPILCIILSGEVYVHSKEGHTDLLLRILRKGDTFGVATLFGQHKGDPITRITASTQTSVLCISESTMRSLLSQDANLTMRYIEFLADRIRFLNARISCLGASTAEGKLCAWLDSVAPQIQGECTYTIQIPMNKLADILGLGRASLYRAFDALSDSGILSRKGKIIHIPCRQSLASYGEA